jgi:hypothetical protein
LREGWIETLETCQLGSMFSRYNRMYLEGSSSWGFQGLKKERTSREHLCLSFDFRWIDGIEVREIRNSMVGREILCRHSSTTTAQQNRQIGISDELRCWSKYIVQAKTRARKGVRLFKFPNAFQECIYNGTNENFMHWMSNVRYSLIYNAYATFPHCWPMIHKRVRGHL